MARWLVIITCSLWLLLLVFGFAVAETPALALIPLVGLYPGEISSPGYDPVKGVMWAVGVGVLYLALGRAAIRRNSQVLAALLMALFFVSSVVFVFRLGHALRGIKG